MNSKKINETMERFVTTVKRKKEQASFLLINRLDAGIEKEDAINLALSNLETIYDDLNDAIKSLKGETEETEEKVL